MGGKYVRMGSTHARTRVIKPASLDLPPLHVSLDRELGDYYQDFSPAIELVESGYHGTVDEFGVPCLENQGAPRYYNAITTAQYALANMTAHRRGRPGRRELARAQAESLLETQEEDGEWAGCWLIRYDNPKYPFLRAPWTSALASGNAMSALLRAWEMFGDDRYRSAAEAAYHGLHVQRAEMRLSEDDGQELWYEEYPADPPMHVLNGHVYCLLGVADYARVSGEEEADSRWRQAAATALARLDEFDLGYWSAYELRWREPAAVHYQKNIHVPQLRILAQLTGQREFATVADRWERYLLSPVSRLRWQLAIRVHGQRQRRERHRSA